MVRGKQLSRFKRNEFKCWNLPSVFTAFKFCTLIKYKKDSLNLPIIFNANRNRPDLKKDKKLAMSTFNRFEKKKH